MGFLLQPEPMCYERLQHALMVCHGEILGILTIVQCGRMKPEIGFTGFESTVCLTKIHCLSVDVDVKYLFVFQVYL